jgi:hypothetical protein
MSKEREGKRGKLETVASYQSIDFAAVFVFHEA